MRKKRIGILTGGGDVQSLNAVIHSAQKASSRYGCELLGFLNGWQGLIDGEFIHLSKVSIDPNIGGTLLKSSRVNLAKVPDAISTVSSNLEKLNIEGLIVIGGEDTLSNSLYLKDFPQALISKTIDNDVGIVKQGAKPRLNDILNYFTLGHPTAARKISSYVSLQEGVRTTAYSHERIIVVESMGMHAGWLALSSCMGKPDFIIVPEFPLRYETFVQKVADVYRKQHHVMCVLAEGARWENGGYISANDSERDSFGHPKFMGAASALVAKLKVDLRPQFDTRNVNAMNPSYLYRSGAPCALDKTCAEMLGKHAVQLLKKNAPGANFLFLKKMKKGFTTKTVSVQDVDSIEEYHRFIDERFYDPETLTATSFGRRYWSSLIPEFETLHYGI